MRSPYRRRCETAPLSASGDLLPPLVGRFPAISWSRFPSTCPPASTVRHEGGIRRSAVSLAVSATVPGGRHAELDQGRSCSDAPRRWPALLTLSDDALPHSRDRLPTCIRLKNHVAGFPLAGHYSPVRSRCRAVGKPRVWSGRLLLATRRQRSSRRTTPHHHPTTVESKAKRAIESLTTLVVVPSRVTSLARVGDALPSQRWHLG